MDEGNIASKKIRIYPNQQQIKLFQLCFRAHRYIYNKAVEDYKNNNEMSHISIRKRIMKSDKDMTDNDAESWLKQIPYDTRAEVIRQFSKNVKVSKALVKNKIIQKFEMKFMSKKDNNEQFIINKKALDIELNIFSSRLKNDKNLKTKKKYKKWIKNNLESIANNCIIARQKCGSYYIIIPYTSKKEYKNNIKEEIVGLDPGARTFQTFYSENTCGKLGEGIVNIINKFNQKIDNLTSVIDSGNITTKTRYKLRKRCNKLRTKICNVVNDLQWKSASFLSKNYKVILLPEFNTKQMVNRKLKKRKIGKLTARNLMCLSHYKFKMRLKYLANKYGSKVIECCECYTSKTCGKCSALNYKLGSSEVFKCNDCDNVVDRDINGARNVVIKSITSYAKNS